MNRGRHETWSMLATLMRNSTSFFLHKFCVSAFHTASQVSTVTINSAWTCGHFRLTFDRFEIGDIQLLRFVGRARKMQSNRCFNDVGCECGGSLVARDPCTFIADLSFHKLQHPVQYANSACTQSQMRIFSLYLPCASDRGLERSISASLSLRHFHRKQKNDVAERFIERDK